MELLAFQRSSVKKTKKLGKMSEKDISRMSSYIDDFSDKHNCWLWNGLIQDKKRKGHQHGTFWFNRKNVMIHRLMYHNFIDDVPDYSENSLVVTHKCSHENNGRCVNPWHLKLGTKSENSRDALKDNTLTIYKSNENNPNSKLSNNEILEIIQMKGTGISQKQIAEKYGVAQSQISRYWNNKTRIQDNL